MSERNHEKSGNEKNPNPNIINNKTNASIKLLLFQNLRNFQLI